MIINILSIIFKGSPEVFQQPDAATDKDQSGHQPEIEQGQYPQIKRS